jgi:predicted metal-binding membrane protein
MSYLGCSVRLFSQLFVGGFMSYLGCSVRLVSQLFVGGFMSYLGWSKDEQNILNKT